MTLLTVIIPTYKRPHLLPKSIESSLLAAPNDDVEVLVIPNGLDESWKSVQEKYKDNNKVRWLPISTNHANAARNHGLKNASGEYIRFIDDDDFFYPEKARAQLRNLIDLNGDLSFANITSLDINSGEKKLLRQILTDDYYTAVLTPTNATAPGGLVYKKNITNNLEWDIRFNKNQDVYWAMLLCNSNAHMKTVRFDEVVSAWVQHPGPRVSQGHPPERVAKELSQQLLASVDALILRNMLTPERARAAVDHLWRCIHIAMFYDPIFWIKIAIKAEEIYPKRNPGTKIYQWAATKNINPIYIEILLIPWRKIKSIFQSIND